MIYTYIHTYVRICVTNRWFKFNIKRMCATETQGEEEAHQGFRSSSLLWPCIQCRSSVHGSETWSTKLESFLHGGGFEIGDAPEEVFLWSSEWDVFIAMDARVGVRVDEGGQTFKKMEQKMIIPKAKHCFSIWKHYSIWNLHYIQCDGLLLIPSNFCFVFLRLMMSGDGQISATRSSSDVIYMTYPFQCFT